MTCSSKWAPVLPGKRCNAAAGAVAPGAAMPRQSFSMSSSTGILNFATAALAVAKSAGASKTILIGGPKRRLETAKRFGADHLIDLDELADAAARLERVRALTHGYGADVVLECVGMPKAVVEGMEMCRDGGKYLVLGHYCNAGTVEFNPHTITRKQLQVFGSWSSEPRHMKAALEFLSTNQERFPFASMVTYRFSIADANQALETTRRWEADKSVIVPDL